MKYHFLCRGDKELRELRDQIIKERVNYFCLPTIGKLNFSRTHPKKTNVPYIHWLKYQPNGEVSIYYKDNKKNNDVMETLPKENESLKKGLVRILSLTRDLLTEEPTN